MGDYWRWSWIKLDIPKAALVDGHKVVASGRNPDKVAGATDCSSNLLVVKLDIMKSENAVTAIEETIKRFGRIDVLANNAANFYAGHFEEQTPNNSNAN
ncbi:MAG: SDR family NAD(P)-dependent oxidoreductase [Chryseolinea sp.]